MRRYSKFLVALLGALTVLVTEYVGEGALIVTTIETIVSALAVYLVPNTPERF